MEASHRRHASLREGMKPSASSASYQLCGRQEVLWARAASPARWHLPLISDAEEGFVLIPSLTGF